MKLSAKVKQRATLTIASVSGLLGILVLIQQLLEAVNLDALPPEVARVVSALLLAIAGAVALIQLWPIVPEVVYKIEYSPEFQAAIDQAITAQTAAQWQHDAETESGNSGQ